MKVTKYLTGVGMALALFVALAAVPPAEAGPACRGTWATYEVQFSFVYGPTGQTWNQGFTYNRFWDCHGNYVTDQGLAQILTFRQDMANQGWRETWCSGDRVIAQGTW